MPERTITLIARLGALTGAERLLLVAPGASGPALITAWLQKYSPHSAFVVEPDRARLEGMKRAAKHGTFVLSRVTNLPFKRHAFDVVLAVECLTASRPAATALAELRRVLKPDGKLLLLEPIQRGWCSKRGFALDDLKARLSHADFEIVEAQVEHDLNCVCAVKRENPAEPVPQYLTAKEMIERRKKKPPVGEELP